MSRTLKYFLKNFFKTAGAIIGLVVYMYSCTYVLINYALLDEDLAFFIVVGVPLFVLGISLMWDSAKHKVKMENLDIINKIKDQ